MRALSAPRRSPLGVVQVMHPPGDPANWSRFPAIVTGKLAQLELGGARSGELVEVWGHYSAEPRPVRDFRRSAPRPSRPARLRPGPRFAAASVASRPRHAPPLRP